MERSIDVPDDKRPSDDLVGRDDQVLAQVNKGSGETEGGVDESSGMTAEDPQSTRQCRYSKFFAYTRCTRFTRPGSTQTHAKPFLEGNLVDISPKANMTAKQTCESVCGK